MPMYMDIHDVPGVRPEDVAKAHLKDLEVQGRHGVEYVKYWVNPKQGKIFCLCTAPDAHAADIDDFRPPLGSEWPRFVRAVQVLDVQAACSSCCLSRIVTLPRV